MEKLDARLNVFREDLADDSLRGRVDARSFAMGQPVSISVAVASVHQSPKTDAVQITQALFGEAALVFERDKGWAWIKLKRDGYVGYVPEQALGAPVTPTHRVANVSTILFADANLKSQPAQHLFLGSEVAVAKTQGTYACLATWGAVHSAHLSRLGQYEMDFVSVAERFLHVPYYWGGKTHGGIDCSSLVQISLQAAGIEALRDSDMQENSLGTGLADHSKLQRGDLVFWPGHVGIMQSQSQIIHANGHHMKVTSEPLNDVIKRSDKPIRSVKRLSD